MEKARMRVAAARGNVVDNYRIVLALTLLSTFTLLFIDIGALGDSTYTSFGAVVVSSILGLTFIFSLHASNAHTRVINFLRIFIVFSIGVSVLAVTFNNFANSEFQIELGGVGLVWVLVAISTPVIISQRILTHNEVDANTMFGAISAYLQFAIAFCYIFMFIEIKTPGLFFGTVQESVSFMYFSLSSITTVGFGDLVSVNEIGRALSSVEAAFGQIFLVVLVATLVSRYTKKK